MDSSTGRRRSRARTQAVMAFAVLAVAAGSTFLTLRHGEAEEERPGPPRPTGVAMPHTDQTPRRGVPTPTGTSKPAGVAEPGPWRLVLEDEFDGPVLDDRMWVTCYDWNVDGCTIESNDEEQWYRPEQVSVRDGEVILDARRVPTPGLKAKKATTYPWASGMISTGRPHWNAEPRFTFQYGFVEAEIKLPREKGMFPAFWLIPANGGAPPEIDVVELYDSTTSLDTTMHFVDGRRGPRTVTKAHGPLDWGADYHRFGLEWAADRVTWYIDGKAVFTVTDPAKIPDVPMEVVLNLAVGVPDSPPSSLNESQMRVRSVRVWQH